jgi:ERCC4-type nuclease
MSNNQKDNNQNDEPDSEQNTESEEDMLIPSCDNTGYKIIIDDRERHVSTFFNDCKFPYEIRRIHIGDFAILKNGKIVIILERKTWADLASTIKSYRKDNIKKLLDMRQKYGCCVGYIIEGIPFPNPKSKVGRIPYANLISHIDHMIMRDNLAVFYTKDHKSTFEKLLTLVKNHSTIKTNVEYLSSDEDNKVKIESDVISTNETSETNIGESKFKSEESKETSGGNMSDLTKPFKKTDLQILYNLWSSIPYITIKTASLFIDANINLKQFLLGKVDMHQISTLKYASGVIIGEKRARKIMEFIKTEQPKQAYSKLLQQIPLVSKCVADLLLESFHFEDIITFDDTEDNRQSLADIKKSEKKRLGDKVVDNLYHYLINV